jgi:hypothetical protein
LGERSSPLKSLREKLIREGKEWSERKAKDDDFNIHSGAVKKYGLRTRELITYCNLAKYGSVCGGLIKCQKWE